MTRLVLAVTLLATQTPSASALFRAGSTQYVGIQYWLQNEDGSRLTEAQAKPARQYSVYLRSNVGGFLMVFSTADDSELTFKTSPPYGGLELRADGEFKLPGTYRLAQDGSSERLVFLVARSQTEMVRTSDQAIEKLARLGPALISETVAEGAELGTYVVNRSGAPTSATIRLTR
jgi:hypothetical protein